VKRASGGITRPTRLRANRTSCLSRLLRCPRLAEHLGKRAGLNVRVPGAALLERQLRQEEPGLGRGPLFLLPISRKPTSDAS
jgi:hypothetical protein